MNINLLSCFCKRDTKKVSINKNFNIKKLFNLKNECLLGWNNKTTGFKTECIKISNLKSKSETKNVLQLQCRLLILVIKTSSHHIILYNYDLNNYVILKLNCIVSNKQIFP